jgi:hypothetical protein
MQTGLSVKILYWTEQIGPNSINDFEGIDEFKKALNEDYISVVQARPGDLGGLYQLVVDFVSNMTLQDVVRIFLEGTTFDLIKSGEKAFVLRPFINAYKALQELNKNSRLDIEELNFTFQDTTIHIDQIGSECITEQLNRIFNTIAVNYEYMRLPSGEAPFEIFLPIFEDTADNRLIRFRSKLDVDETIVSFKAADYFNYWGAVYDYARKWMVYDLANKQLLDEEFYNRQRYWQSWESKNR